ADPRGLVTTPWDMMVNQAVEMTRGSGRHGSCGLGFGETVGRFEERGSALRVGDLHEIGLAEKLADIRDCWLPERLAELGLTGNHGPLEFAHSRRLLDRFLRQCADFAAAVPMRSDAAIGGEDTLIFEGAQGLLLDRDGADFPFLTRSRTGLANVHAIAAEAGIGAVETTYVTRCYLTRHGRGPMEDERDIARWYDVVDPTNRPNRWQESLRFGLLDIAKLARRLRQQEGTQSDLRGTELALTCCDQVRDRHAWLSDDRLVEGPIEMLCEALAEATGMEITTFASPVNVNTAIKRHKVFSSAG
ncbi:MAG: adenylosuccinate synthetase, partial [Alteraurantiacibacter sp.]